MSTYEPFSSDGHVVHWQTWAGDGDETTELRWENEGWTVTGQVSLERVQYVLRLSASWQVRQFLLFRDMDDPDLWLANDGNGTWGEMNGMVRPELAGCDDIDLLCTPFTNTLPIRRLALDVGQTSELQVVYVDPETLEVRPDTQRYTRLGARRWGFEQLDTAYSVEFDVDRHGVVIDYPDLFRRVD